MWTADGGGPTAYLRVLEDGAALRVGRVCTRKDARGDGLAAVLLADVLRRHPDRAVVLDAQSYLVGWYERFGFAVTGPEFLEDGIPHTPDAPGAVGATRPPGGGSWRTSAPSPGDACSRSARPR